MTNKEKIELVNKLLLEVFIDNQEKEIDYYVDLENLKQVIINVIVDYWYTYLEPDIFQNHNGVEPDEHLKVEEYDFNFDYEFETLTEPK
jgi:hypothetical protein